MARPTSAVVDASVAAKWFLEEENSEEALALRDAHVRGDIILAAPTLIVYELSNALRYDPRIGSRLLAEHVGDLFDLQIRLDDPTEDGLAEAIDVAYRTGVTVYDASYVALAERLDWPLITVDGIQKNAAPGRARDLRRWAEG